MLGIDIETIPTLAAMATPYPEAERLPPSNYTKTDTVAAWREMDRARWDEERIKAYSLNPRMGRVLNLSYQWAGAHARAEYATTESEEHTVLASFWEQARTWDQHSAGPWEPLVTWNGGHFDLRFILMRSMKLGVQPTISRQIIRDWFRRYAYYPHFDVMAAVLNWDMPQRGETLDAWCEFTGVARKVAGMSGKDVYPYFLAGRHTEIQDYGNGDVGAMMALFEKVHPYFAAQEMNTNG